MTIGHENIAMEDAERSEQRPLTHEERRAAAIAKAESELNLRSTEKEVDAVLKANGFMREFDYARDSHFTRWVLNNLKTKEEVWAFIDQLASEAIPFAGTKHCSKAYSMRSWLTGSNAKFWLRDVERMRTAISHGRRVCCGCHDQGSFKIRAR